MGLRLPPGGDQAYELKHHPRIIKWIFVCVGQVFVFLVVELHNSYEMTFYWCGLLESICRAHSEGWEYTLPPAVTPSPHTFGWFSDQPLCVYFDCGGIWHANYTEKSSSDWDLSPLAVLNCKCSAMFLKCMFQTQLLQKNTHQQLKKSITLWSLCIELNY